MVTVGELLRSGVELLRGVGIEGPTLDAEVLVASVLGCTRLDLVLRHQEALTPEVAGCARRALETRAAGVPVAYIVGTREFRGRTFEVGPGVLCPRPETEHLVEEALAEDARRRPESPLRVLELGVGSGCVALCLALELPHAVVVGTELSKAALNQARRNAERLGEKILLLQGNLFDPLEGQDLFHLVVANPPYLSQEEYEMAGLEVRAEPRRALVSSPDATSLAERVLTLAPDWLVPGGALLLEVGFGQSDSLLSAARRVGRYGTEERVVPDLAGIPRVLVLHTSPGR